MPRPRSYGPFLAALSCLSAGCGRPALPDPRKTALDYADAAVRGDSARIYALLSREARRSLGRDGTRRLVREARRELEVQGRALRAPRVTVEATAEVLLSDGSEVELSLEDGEFRVDAAATLPSAARTPAQALDGLRRALVRRSYPALLRVLSVEARGALERDLRALVDGLQDPASLDVKVNGDRADIELPGGHSVSLKREQGVWRVEDVK
jgi:hypothetical protein